MTDIIKALEHVLNVCPPIDQHGEMAQEEARAALSQHAAEQAVEPLGYLSEHTGPDGPHKWQFSKTSAGIYRDTALRVFAIYHQGGTSAAAIQQAKPTLCRYRTRIKGQKAPWTDWTECSAAAADEFERVNCEQWEYEVQRLYAAPKQAEQQAGPVAEFRGRRLTPEGTTEFWGVMLCDPMQDPPKGAKLYLGPVNDPVPSDWRSVIPGGRFTDKGESCRVADFNEGWNAYRKAAIANLAAHRATQQAQATSPVADELLDAYMHACGRSDLAARDEVRRRLAAMLSQQAQASESLIALPPLPAIQTTNVHEQAHIHELREQNTKLREWLTHWRLRAQQFERHFASKQASESAEALDAGQALDLLAILFDAYENGAPCFDDPDEGSFIGNAVRLSNDDFHRCADLLNKHRPAQHKEQT